MFASPTRVSYRLSCSTHPINIPTLSLQSVNIYVFCIHFSQRGELFMRKEKGILKPTIFMTFHSWHPKRAPLIKYIFKKNKNSFTLNNKKYTRQTHTRPLVPKLFGSTNVHKTPAGLSPNGAEHVYLVYVITSHIGSLPLPIVPEPRNVYHG